MLSATAGLNTASVYKMYGNQFPTLKSDAYLAMVGGVGSIANGMGRTGWGILQDKLGFRKVRWSRRANIVASRGARR